MRTQPWFVDAVPRARRPDYSRLRGHIAAPIAIVGGGLTGAACAATFAAAGVRVVLVEADRIGAGATGSSHGLLREDFDASFEATIAAYGLRTARHLWQGMRRASLDCSAALKRMRVRCDLEAQPGARFTRGETAAARALQHEYRVRRDAGLDATWLNRRAFAKAAAVDAEGAMRVPGRVLDPYRATLGLAAVAVKKGALVYERSAVVRVRTAQRHIELRTTEGTIEVGEVVIATGAPVSDLAALARHFEPRESYTVVTDPLPAAVRREVGPRTIALADEGHLLRWLRDDRVLFAGGERSAQPARTRGRSVVPSGMELMYQLTTWYPAISGVQPAAAWSTVSHHTADGLPIIGRHRNFPRHLFALGTARHGAAVAWLAARLLLREYLGEPAPHDELFGFNRLF